MKALIVENNLVVTTASDFTVIGNAYVTGDFGTGISTERGTVVDCSECPGTFVPMSWSFFEGVWQLVNKDVVDSFENTQKEAKGAEVRAERDKLLAESDWTQLPDVNLSNKADWTKYRQDLRDVTKQAGFPYDVVFPKKPDATEKTSVEVL